MENVNKHYIWQEYSIGGLLPTKISLSSSNQKQKPINLIYQKEKNK